jgi:ABC-type transport system substrate-binding protein
VRRVTIVLIAVLAASALASCRSGHKSSTTIAPKRGGTLRIGIASPASLDPALARTRDELLVADQLFDGVTGYDRKTLEPGPGLASRWQASADQKQWDFFIRADAKFSNGRAVTSADVKYSLERVAKSTASPAAESLGFISGFKAFTSGSAPGLAGITTPSPEVVHVVLDQPFSVLPSLLSSPLYGVVARESVETPPAGGTFADLPAVTSGPFTVQGRTDNVITLRPAPGSRGMVTQIDLHVFPDVGAAYRAFVAGTIDFSTVPPDQVQDAVNRSGRGAFRAYLGELYYSFNLKDARFADPRLRRAIAHAVDRQAIVRAVYQNTVLPLDGVVVAGVPGYAADACGDVCRHDPAEAKRLIAEMATGGAIPTIQIAYGADPAQEAVAKAIQANLHDAGITAELVPKSAKDYPDFAVSGQQQLFQAAWIAQYPSPDDFLAPLFLTGAPNNLSKFSSSRPPGPRPRPTSATSCTARRRAR